MNIKWGLKVEKAHGKVGHVIAIHTRAGWALWHHKKPRQPKTSAQRELRNAFRSLSMLWADASMATYRHDWKALALAHPEPNIYGADVYKTGCQWFIRANRNRLTIGESVLFAAPAWAAVDEPGPTTLSHVHGPPAYLYIIPTDSPAATDAVIIFASRALSPGKVQLGHQQRMLTYVKPSTPGLWDIIVEYILKFGTPTTGQKVFVEVWYMDIAQGRIGKKRQAWDYW